MSICLVLVQRLACLAYLPPAPPPLLGRTRRLLSCFPGLKGPGASRYPASPESLRFSPVCLFFGGFGRRVLGGGGRVVTCLPMPGLLSPEWRRGGVLGWGEGGVRGVRPAAEWTGRRVVGGSGMWGVGGGLGVKLFAGLSPTLMPLLCHSCPPHPSLPPTRGVGAFPRCSFLRASF